MKIHGLLQKLAITVLNAFNSHDFVKVSKILQHLSAKYQ